MRGARYGIVAALAAAIMLAPLDVGAQESGTLNIATWGGAYGQSQEIAYFEPFAKETGTKIEMEIYDGSLAKIREMIDGGGAVDVMDVSSATLGTLCRNGLLEPIEVSTIGSAPGGVSAENDFFAGGLSACGVASMAWSTAIAFDRRAFAKAPPTSIAALLDTKAFPGKRALPNGPRYTLELALLADGVAPEQIYSELATPAGVDRAFAALDRITGDIIWWDNAQEPLEWLLARKAAMAASYSGRIFRASVVQRQRIGVIWDGQIYDLDLWAIPKGAKNKDIAKRFINFASEPGRLATQAQLIAYGPMRRSALDLVGKHPVVNVDMKTFLPTAPDNFKRALRFDDSWWNDHGEALGKRFEAWRAGASAAEAKPQDASGESGQDAPPSEGQDGAQNAGQDAAVSEEQDAAPSAAQ
jgi:putative spermidine/putrescine transport system substrate-binding protein